MRGEERARSRGGKRGAAPGGLLPWAALAAAALCAAAAVLLAHSPADPPPDFGDSASPPHATAGPPREQEAPQEAGAGRAVAAEPVGVRVPRLDMTARIRPVGVRDDGTMAIPGEPGAAGWYRWGPAPGATQGSAVLVGHVDYESGELGDFAALYEVRAGDRVTVRRAGAPPVRYEVTVRRTVAQEELPPEVFRRQGTPVLTLITCAPPYEEDSGYRNNLIVTAEPVAR